MAHLHMRVSLFIFRRMNKMITILVLAIIFVLIDLYIFQALKVTLQQFSLNTRKIIFTVYWAITIVSVSGLLFYNLGGKELMPHWFQSLFISLLFVNYFPKVFGVLFLMVDDLVRAGKWTWQQFSSNQPNISAPNTTEASRGDITRSEFLAKASLIAVAVPAATLGFGIISGAHDYKIRKVKIALPNLPASFDGIRLAQLSDIHSGSFFNKTAVQGGVDMLLQEKPDVVFFTGDLVNNESSEINNYFDVFKKVSAPLGVFSSTGNHDYGDYRSWPSVAARRQNFQALIEAHKLMGWDILMNENRYLELNGDKIAIIGIENWGTKFSKHGDLKKAYQGTEDAATKLLLSHDPSHWDAQVRPEFSDIDVTFAGHTHGFQFGIEVGNFKWSPSQYIYKQWAGLYQTGPQYLYVNRGFGYIGFTGRIGILPEITMFELVKA